MCTASRFVKLSEYTFVKRTDIKKKKKAESNALKSLIMKVEDLAVGMCRTGYKQITEYDCITCRLLINANCMNDKTFCKQCE